MIRAMSLARGDVPSCPRIVRNCPTTQCTRVQKLLPRLFKIRISITTFFKYFKPYSLLALFWRIRRSPNPASPECNSSGKQSGTYLKSSGLYQLSGTYLKSSGLYQLSLDLQLSLQPAYRQRFRRNTHRLPCVFPLRY